MKVLKISLVVIAVAIVAFVCIMIGGRMVDPPHPPIPDNQFIKSIKKNIDSIKTLSSSRFCGDLYEEIDYQIKYDYKKGHLGDTANGDNEQWRDILQKDLYAAYASKFVEQVMYVFNGHVWEINDLRFIREELKKLRVSGYLEKNSPMDKDFKKIQIALSKYDEINGFISGCRNYTCRANDLTSSFPDMGDKVRMARVYLSTDLGNEYVSNCDRLRENLAKVPMWLFEKHVTYLECKIRQYAGQYEEYTSQKHYSRVVYQPLLDQILDLDNNVYGINHSEINRKKGELASLLDKYNDRAYDEFN